MTAFLMTWKKGHWPHEYILRMLEEFRSKGSVIEPWRIAAHTKSYLGAKVWLLKQGGGEKGIFGAGEVVGTPELASTSDGNERTMVSVRFSFLTDPLKEFLIREEKVRKVLSSTQMRTQSSGITISDIQSNELQKFLVSAFPTFEKYDSLNADEDFFDPENVSDARDRVLRSISQRRGQKDFRDALLKAYERRCALTACPILDILEAAHIFPYLGSQTNQVSNGLLLRADIHTLFDCGLLGVSPSDFTVIIAPALHGTTYEKLKGRKIRMPNGTAAVPSRKALERHLKENGLWPAFS